MLLAIDVHYKATIAKTVAIEFDHWQADTCSRIIELELPINEVGEYVPGEFYKRELPCIQKILSKVNMKDLEVIIVDGYVRLNQAGKKGLGAYLYEAIHKTIPVIGLAKRNFNQADDQRIPILRGKSQNPLFVTSIGIDVQQAAQHIQNMKGNYRMPDLFRLLDQKTKENESISNKPLK